MIHKGTYFKTQGGFGNRLLHYIDARKKGFIPYFNYKKLFLITGCKTIPVSFNSKTKLELLETFIGLDYTDLKNILTLPQSANTGTVIHFRGKDFAKWKPHSIITSRWYIEQLKQFHIKNFVFVTDDIDHKTSKKLLQFAKENNINYTIYDSTQFLADWWVIFNSKTLITGPSTFSLTAGILGKSKIILNKKYAEIEANNGRNFWSYLFEPKTTKTEIFTNIFMN